MIRPTKNMGKAYLLRFLFVGAINTMVGYLIFAILYFMLSSVTHYIVPALIAHLLAVSFSFLTQKKIVFRSKKNWRQEYARFHLNQAGIFVFSFTFMLMSVELLRLHPLSGQAISLLLTTALSYWIHRHHSFSV